MNLFSLLIYITVVAKYPAISNSQKQQRANLTRNVAKLIVSDFVDSKKIIMNNCVALENFHIIVWL